MRLKVDQMIRLHQVLIFKELGFYILGNFRSLVKFEGPIPEQMYYKIIVDLLVFTFSISSNELVDSSWTGRWWTRSWLGC